MLKKVLALIVVLSLVLSLAGCSLFGKGDYYSSEYEYLDDTSDKEDEPVEVYKTNPLTGIKNLTDDNINNRPVAVMINNIKPAQSVQTGLNSADIIYETEVEGGITRLMAVFKDFNSVGQLGSVRSARYPYVDLALGHDAIYVHCGQDPTYCAPHLKDIDDMSVDSGSTGAKRIKNGLASEHTLYVFGSELWPALASKFKSTVSSNTLWQNFAAEDEKVTLSGGGAIKVTVPFPSLKTIFEYDDTTGLYTRYSNTDLRKDYVTGENITVKNVFVLLTTITTYPDGKHRRVALTGGDGFYATNGTVTPIKWQKNGERAPIKITDQNGGQIKVSAGRSWVCIPNSSTCKPVFEAPQPTTTTSSNS